MHLLKSEYYELPSKYDKTIIRLLVQSPTRIFVYWEVSDETIKLFESFKKNYSNSTPVLKVDNLTLNYSYNIQIDPYANNYYIDVKDTDCEYKVELGRLCDGVFHNIYTSNNAHVPRSMPLPMDYSKEVIYRNYLRMDLTDKFKLSAKHYDSNNKEHQNYLEIPFSDQDGISSMENISSLCEYTCNNKSNKN